MLEIQLIKAMRGEWTMDERLKSDLTLAAAKAEYDAASPVIGNTFEPKAGS